MTEDLTINPMHGREHAGADELRTAATLGRRAHAEGRPAAPGADHDLRHMIGNGPVGRPRTRELMQAFSDAYQAECDRAAAAVLADEEADRAALAAERDRRRKTRRAAASEDPWAEVLAMSDEDRAAMAAEYRAEREREAAELEARTPDYNIVPSRFD